MVSGGNAQLPAGFTFGIYLYCTNWAAAAQSWTKKTCKSRKPACVFCIGSTIWVLRCASYFLFFLIVLVTQVQVRWCWSDKPGRHFSSYSQLDWFPRRIPEIRTRQGNRTRSSAYSPIPLPCSGDISHFEPHLEPIPLSTKKKSGKKVHIE